MLRLGCRSGRAEVPCSAAGPPPVTTPGAPQNLSGVPGDEQVTLSWDAPSSDGGSAIIRYEYAIDDSGTWIDADLDLEETVPDLTNGQPYPSQDGRGLSTRIGSAWGATQSGVQSLWSRQDASGLVRNAALDAAQRYQVELRYGLDGLKGRARWAPYYIGVESGGGSRQALRQGVTLTLGRFDAALELGQRQVGPGADPEHAVQLRGTLRW